MMKILMVTMRMAIGGAETHILELSSALAAQGHSVTVASAGGVFADVLRERGIAHITLPLDRKTPFSLWRSYRGLQRLICRESFDIVHAHARIPAFLCGKLQKRLHFRFVTTCHASFRVTPFLKKETYWGDRTFAVSEDLRRYLAENYDIDPAHVYLTVNGIDTEAFSPHAGGEECRRALGISGGRLILHVSRLEKESSYCAERLIESAALLPASSTVVIVGGGGYEASLRAKAEEMNERLGRTAVILTGARTDIADTIAACDVFVGPSRAAMEALACGKPTVVSGSEGHGGVFDESLAGKASLGNFCFRQSPLPTAQGLAGDIVRLLSMDEAEKGRLSAYGRAFIEENYSIKRMLTSHLDVYSAIAPYRTSGDPDIVICGYYGYGNAGDESMLSALVDGLRRIDPALGICVLSARPKETRRRYLVDAVYRFDLFAAGKKLRNAKLFLFGGGNLLQDRTSGRSLFYYTEMLALAHRCRTRIMVYANGIGPIDSPRNLDRVKRALALADSISLRDKASFALCKELVPSKSIRMTFDPAVIPTVEYEEGQRDGFTVIPKRNSAEILEKTAVFIEKIGGEYGLKPEILCLYDGEDLAYCRRLSARTGASLSYGLTDEEVARRLSRSALVLSSRLHGLIYATVACTPMMSFSDDCKLESYLDTIGFGKASSICAVSALKSGEKELFAVGKRLLTRGDEVREALKTALPTLRAMADYEIQEAVRAAHLDND